MPYANVFTGTTTGATDAFAEQVQDVVAAMIAAGVQSNITISYDDVAGTLSFSVGATYSDEQAQDAVAAAIAAGTHQNVTVVYDDVNNKLSFQVASVNQPTAALTFGKDTLTATSDGQTVFNTGVTYAPTTRLAFAVKIGGEMHFVDFTHTAPAGVNTITLTNGLSAPIDAQVVVYYLAR